MSFSRVFQVDGSLVFAVQVPDDSVGCSSSRCSNCGGVVAYCEHICKHCKMPLAGPFGFPQIGGWQDLSDDQRQALVERVFRKDLRRGRLGFVNVHYFPLTMAEVSRFERLSEHDRDLAYHVHGFGLEELEAALRQREATIS